MAEASLSIRYVRVLVDSVEHCGVTRSNFLGAAQWDPQRLTAVEGRVPYSEYGSLIELAIELSRDPALGLHTLKAIRIGSADLITPLLLHAATLRDALESLIALHQLMGDERWYQLSETNRYATLRFECPTGFSPRVTRFLSELHLHGMYALLRSFTPQARPARVHFAYRAPAYRAEYERIFGGTERFAQPCTALVFDRALMSAARAHHDEELHRSVRELAASRVLRLSRGASCTELVRDLLARHETPSAATMTSVARALNISPRTLRRRLAAEGTSYDAVANAALAHRARVLLSVEQRTIHETAVALGYSDASAFHRAFKRWTGTTPSTYRGSSGS